MNLVTREKEAWKLASGKVLLFSYGTLQKREVQIANFGRELMGREDALPGYGRRMVPILDSEPAPAGGETEHANAEPSDADESVAGMVFEVTEEELQAADRYEAPARYRRIAVVLRSGERAWVYVRD